MNYLFPITYFNAFEKKLPDYVDIERMIASESLEKSISVLQDTHYADFISQDSSVSFKEIVEKEEIFFRKNLFKMGFSENIVEFLYLKKDLFNLGLEIKKDIFGIDFSEEDLVNGSGLKQKELKEKYIDLVEKIDKNPPKNPIKMDEQILDFYLEKSIKISKKLKDKNLKNFFVAYRNTFKEKEEVEKKLLSIEKNFLEKNKWKINGLASIFAFLLKKDLAKKKLEIIFSAKQLKLEVEKINKLIENLPALI